MGIIKAVMGIKGAINRLTGKVAPTLYIEDIEKHFNKLFDVGEDEHTVFHEIMSEYVHIDIHIIKPAENRPFYVLYTTGMSDLPMTMDEDAPWDFKKINERAEIFCILPEDWKLEDKLSKEDTQKYMWIISAMKKAARYPHMCKTWLSFMHTLQYTEDNTPFSPYTKLSSAIFMRLNEDDFGGKYEDDLGGLYAEDGTYINLLCLVPLYKEEMDFKLEHGSGELCMKLFGEAIADFKQLEIDMDRKNVCI